MSATAPTSSTARGSRPTHGPRAIIAAVVAGVITLTAVIGIGWIVSAPRRAISGAENLQGLFPVSGWTAGAAQSWQAQIGGGAEVFSVGERILALTRKTERDSAATLTAYTLEDSGLSEAWTTTVDLSQGTIPQERPQFLRWGDHHLIHGSTVIDLTTGGTSVGPWPAGGQLMVAQDVVIVCSIDDNCAAWREGSDEQLWNISIENASALISRDNNSQTVYRRAGARYVILAFHSAVNLDTGEQISFNLPPLSSYSLLSATDGWLVHSTGSSGSIVYAFGLEGGEAIETYSDNENKSHDKDSIFLWISRPLPLSTYRAVWRDGDTSGIALRFIPESDECIPRIDVVDGASITMPDLATNNGSTRTVTRTCISRLRLTADRSLLMTSISDRLETNSFFFLFNAATGEQIDFEGIDVNAGGQLMLVRPDLILGYDPATGTARAFVPKS